PISVEAERLAASLIKNGPMPKEYPEDALHIAVATVNGMDYLLTWNFTHINNAQMKAKITSVIEAEKLSMSNNMFTRGAFWRIKMKDPIVEEVREARNKHARQFNLVMVHQIGPA
ncbi:MAG: hypothetical protein D6732_27640, partial [Methanobacteriota archaeon]